MKKLRFEIGVKLPEKAERGPTIWADRIAKLQARPGTWARVKMASQSAAVSSGNALRVRFRHIKIEATSRGAYLYVRVLSGAKVKPK